MIGNTLKNATASELTALKTLALEWLLGDPKIKFSPRKINYALFYVFTKAFIPDSSQKYSKQAKDEACNWRGNIFIAGAGNSENAKEDEFGKGRAPWDCESETLGTVNLPCSFWFSRGCGGIWRGDPLREVQAPEPFLQVNSQSGVGDSQSQRAAAVPAR